MSRAAAELQKHEDLEHSSQSAMFQSPTPQSAGSSEETQFIIWDSTLDLSKNGINKFCRQYAQSFGKTPDELKSLPLLELAAIYMTSVRSKTLFNTRQRLSYEVGAPIAIISETAGFLNRKNECSLLESENLRDILKLRSGLNTRFYTDGQDLRCDDLTENGMNYHIFRRIDDPKAFGVFARTYTSRSGFPSKEELDRFSSSLVPVIDRLYDRLSTRFYDPERRKTRKHTEKEIQR